MLFSATTTRKNHEAESKQGRTYHSSTKQAREDDAFLCNYCRRKVIYFNQITEAHDIKAQDWNEGIKFILVQLLPEKVINVNQINEVYKI